jgi:hypothetical protein
MKRKGPSIDDTIRVTASLEGKIEIRPQAAPVLGPVSYLFPGTTSFNEVDNVVWFSKLREEQQLDELIRFVREKFPIITESPVSTRHSPLAGYVD